MGERSDLDKDSLKIGDYVLFKDVVRLCHLSVEGILIQDMCGVTDITSLHDSIFCVHQLRQYSAARELNIFLDAYKGQPITDESEQKYLKALERGRDNENKLNDNYLRKKQGQVVLFGDIIQLFHVKSGKYLQVVPGKLAFSERENVCITLDSSGNRFSWIQICPRFKIDREGDRILSNAEVYLKVAERGAEYIHTADRDPPPGEHREVNCSLESTSWKLNIFQSVSDALDKTILLASQLVFINDPEIRCNLTVAQEDVENFTDEPEESTDKEEENKEKEGSHASNEEVEKKKYAHRYGDIILDPVTVGQINSNFLWFLESSSMLVGGPIKWKTDQVRFKHMNTGLYLKQEVHEYTNEDGENVKDNVFTTTAIAEEVGTLFNVSELNSTNKCLSNAKASQIGHTGVWIERGPPCVDSYLSYEVKGTKDKSSALNLIIHRYTAKIKESKEGEEEEEEVDEAKAAEQASASKEPLDVFVGLSARGYLRKYYEMTVMPGPNESANTVWPSGNRSDVETFEKIVRKTVSFSQGFSITQGKPDAKDTEGKCDLTVRKQRQNLLREQGTLETVIRMIHLLIPISEMSEVVKSGHKKSVDNSLLTKMGQTILTLCFSILFSAIKDNDENQMYVADFMPALLSHLNTQEQAVECVTEMLSQNLELQETKIGTREIQIFVDKLRSSKMNAMYLQLLQSCCSCQGEGVDGNQCKVANMLFTDEGAGDIIIKLSAEFIPTRNVKDVLWKEAHPLYVKKPPNSESIVRAHDVLSSNEVVLSVTWNTTEEGDLMTNYKTMKLEELFDNHDHRRTMMDVDTSGREAFGSPSSVKFSSDSVDKNDKGPAHSMELFNRSAVCKYFIAEMFLGAEMCLDRNYVAMHKLDDLFPFEVLVAIMRMNISSQLKSAALRLLMCLHVDRDPQATSKIPCLTRTWSDIKKNTEPQLPYVDANRRYTFGLIQQLISEHIQEMSGNRWTELSSHVLKMLRCLVMFNFYGTNERIKDVIGPIIAALDRRKVIFSVKPVETPSQKLLKGPSGKFAMQTSQPDLSILDDDEQDEIESVSSSGAEKMERRAEANKKFGHLLSAMNSLRGQAIICIFVILSLVVDIYQIAAGSTFKIGTPLFFVEIGILGLFVIEISIRAYSTHRISSILTFLMDPFNVIDVMAVIVNVVVLFISPMIDHGVSFVKIARLARLYKVFHKEDARIDADEVSLEMQVGNFKISDRYSKAPVHELNTMVEAVDILAFLQRIIEDRNISLLLRNFYEWENGDKRSPAELFAQVIEDSKQLTLNVADFDNVMMDVLMFNHTPLVQSTLEVFMAHHSLRRTLLDNAKDVQLLASSKREKQYQIVDQMLQQLEQNAETHELWGELETEADHKVNVQTKDILNALIDTCRVRRFVLEFDEDYQADPDIQNLYRNLGCFDICMKVLGLMESVEEDENGEFSAVALNTIELCRLCNTLLYWFFLGNEKNQIVGYDELPMFLDTLDDNIKSHLVITALFKGNEYLMRQVDHKHLSDLVENIVKKGKSPHYLSLFAAISHVGDINIIENQFEIVKTLTSPGRLDQVSCFFCSIDHPDYDQKRELMAPYLNESSDLSLDDIPPLLAYHLKFLEVLSGCTVGRANLTTVEAKVQSVYNYVDILQSILDPGTITVAKIRLSNFFYNSIIEVELKIPGLEQSAYVWALLNTYANILGYAKDELRTVEKLGWESPDVSRQKIEYIFVCILIAGGFFKAYYDPITFRYNDFSGGEKVNISLNQVNELITKLFEKIKEIYDLDSPRLSQEYKDQIFTTMEILNKSTSKVIVSNLVPNTSPLQAASKTEVLTVEGKLVDKFRHFIEEIENDANVQSSTDKENVAFIEMLENLPSISDNTDADVRKEVLIQKLVQHIRDNIKFVSNQKRLDARVTKTSRWIIRAFRTMIENKMGMSIYERDEEGGADEDERAAPVVNALNSCGATALCLDLIADGIDEGLQLEAVRLGVGLLFKEGGALEVQELMHNHLNKTNSELFFKQVKMTLQKLQDWHTWNKDIILAENEEPKPPDSILIVRFLQLMCEGHYLLNQDIMREQPNNHVNFNLLDSFVAYLDCLSRNPCRTSTSASIRVAATILEVIQGPCEGNQKHFALGTELIETLNRINRSKLIKDCVEEEETELKKTSIDIFQGLLEGQGEKSVVYERVLSVIHLDIVQMMSKGMAAEFVDEEGKLQNKVEVPEDQVILQTECVVLLQMLCNFKPSLYDELGISKNIDDIVGSGTAMIEIIWRGGIHRRFFHVPAICDYLAKSSKDNLVENVNRTNAENKLIDFLARSHDLYREVKHQQFLTEWKVSNVFSRKNHNIATWFGFFLAILINCLFIVYYNTGPDNSESPGVRSSGATITILILNALQTVNAGFVLLMSFVLRTPVVYAKMKTHDYTDFQTILYTALDPQTLYFTLYLVLSLFGILLADYYLPFLLLDIISKNATTRDVLNAVVIPRKQLGMTVVLAIFLNYIYAFFIFLYFPKELGGVYGVGVFGGENDCKNLWGCFKFVLCYGLRQGGGVGDVMELSIGTRWLIDTTYFIVVIVVLLNVVFGIIIDTFSSLRNEKNERLVDTEEICFICGIDKQTFDRASDEPDGFKTHIKIDHNMWNYLYFIFMLWEQDKDDDDGLEQFVRRAIEAEEIIWFPQNKAIRLDQAATEEEMTLKNISEELMQFENQLTKKLSHFQAEMNTSLDQIAVATRNEYKVGEVKNSIARFLMYQVQQDTLQDDGNDSATDTQRMDEEGSLGEDASQVNNEEIFDGDVELDHDEDEDDLVSASASLDHQEGEISHELEPDHEESVLEKNDYSEAIFSDNNSIGSHHSIKDLNALAPGLFEDSFVSNASVSTKFSMSQKLSTQVVHGHSVLGSPELFSRSTDREPVSEERSIKLSGVKATSASIMPSPVKMASPKGSEMTPTPLSPKSQHSIDIAPRNMEVMDFEEEHQPSKVAPAVVEVVEEKVDDVSVLEDVEAESLVDLKPSASEPEEVTKKEIKEDIEPSETVVVPSVAIVEPSASVEEILPVDDIPADNLEVEHVEEIIAPPEAVSATNLNQSEDLLNKQQFAVGERVLVNRDGLGMLSAGRIVSYLADEDSYDIEYDDGDFEGGVAANLISKQEDELKVEESDFDVDFD